MAWVAAAKAISIPSCAAAGGRAPGGTSREESVNVAASAAATRGEPTLCRASATAYCREAGLPFLRPPLQLRLLPCVAAGKRAVVMLVRLKVEILCMLDACMPRGFVGMNGIMARC